MSGCENSGAAGVDTLCTCIYDRLRSAGLDSEAKMQALVAEWRRTFLAKGVIAFPPAIRGAFVDCLSQKGVP